MNFISVNSMNDTPAVDVYQAVGSRENQEDTYVVCKVEMGLLVAVADGHCGSKTAEKVAAHLPLMFHHTLEQIFKGSSQSRYIGLSHEKMRKVLRDVCKQLIALTNDEVAGSTLTVAFIERGTVRNDKEYGPRVRVTVGQMGDSVFAASETPGHLCVAPMHNVQTATKDIEQIRAAYAKKYNKECRVSKHYIHSCGNGHGGLAVTRALGDMPYILVRKPVIKTYTMQPDNAIILLASDGILTTIDDSRKTIRQYMSRLREGSSVQAIGDGITRKPDNVTIISIRFDA